jgi:hypothetical protein
MRARPRTAVPAVAAADAGTTSPAAGNRTGRRLIAAMLLAYLLGLSSYGLGEPDPADDADAGREVRFPVS